MTYSKQPPNRPGLWRWRFNSSVRDHPHDVFTDSRGKNLVIVLDGTVVTAESLGGEWTGPFVHVDEIKIACERAIRSMDGGDQSPSEEAVTPYDSMR